MANEDLAQEGQPGEQIEDCNRARAMHQRGSIGVKNTRSYCSSQRMAYQEEVPSCNNICGPLQFTIICIPANVNEHRRDIGGKDLI